MTKEELEKEATAYALEWGDKTDGTYACCRDGYLASAEPREKRIEELEAEVKEWKDKADLWCNTANLKDHNIMINKELEKENAKLKELLEACKQERIEALYRNEQYIKENTELKKQLVMSNKVYNDNLDYSHHIEDQLTKATKIIKKLYAVYYDPCVTESDLKYRDELFAEIEQFLKECK